VQFLHFLVLLRQKLTALKGTNGFIGWTLTFQGKLSNGESPAYTTKLTLGISLIFVFSIMYSNKNLTKGFI
jgi:hypothetical protein